MSTIHKIRRGLDIRLKGLPENTILDYHSAGLFAVRPDDITGFIPKLLVKEGEKVEAGTPVFFHKDDPAITIASPVSGTVKEIRRGDRRKILDMLIEPDVEISFKPLEPLTVPTLNREQVIEKLQLYSLWVFLTQRPFGIIANPKDQPKAIFISVFDSSPLAPDLNIILKNEKDNFNKGIEVLSKLTSGKIHLGLNGNKPSDSFFEHINGVEKHYFSGPHPAGNVGVQIHHIDPINRGEIVWTIRPEDVALIGRCFLGGKYDISRIVALSGSELTQTGYIAIRAGAAIRPVLANRHTNENVRIISGNVLTGYSIGKDGYLGMQDRVLTVIPEGNHHEFLGWAMPGFGKFSAGRTFLSWLMPGKKYRLDTNLNGGERAYVLTGQYESVMPMDILPQHLMKAAITNDVEKLEKLGIYEVIEEDMALCEYVCTSKVEVQQILRNAIQLMIKEMS